jgi:hypothetical protein
MAEMRRCKKCGRDKLLSEFNFIDKAQRLRRHECKVCHAGRMNIWHRCHKPDAKERAADWYKDNPFSTWPEEKKDRGRAVARKLTKQWLDVVIEHYGSRCVCCGETNRGFLTIDHINNDGAELRKKLHGKSGVSFYRWIYKNGYPDWLQVLCYNCNFGRQRAGGICPHHVKEGSSTIAQASTPQAGWKRPGRPRKGRQDIVSSHDEKREQSERTVPE